MTASLLWPIVVGVLVVLFAPTLLFATALLERLIALPADNHDLLGQQSANVRINRKER